MNNKEKDDIEIMKFQYDKLLQSTYQDSTIAYVLFTLFFGFAAGIFIFTATLDIVIETIAFLISLVIIILCNYIVDRFLIAGDIRRTAMLYLESKMKIDNFRLFVYSNIINDYNLKFSNNKIEIPTFGNFIRRRLSSKGKKCYEERIDNKFINKFKEKQLRASEAIYFISLTLIIGFFAHVVYRIISILIKNLDVLNIKLFILFILLSILFWYGLRKRLYR